MVAIMLFNIGVVVSIYEGVSMLRNGDLKAYGPTETWAVYGLLPRRQS
jgi:hypothetical protein